MSGDYHLAFYYSRIRCSIKIKIIIIIVVETILPKIYEYILKPHLQMTLLVCIKVETPPKEASLHIARDISINESQYRGISCIPFVISKFPIMNDRHVLFVNNKYLIIDDRIEKMIMYPPIPANILKHLYMESSKIDVLSKSLFGFVFDVIVLK